MLSAVNERAPHARVLRSAAPLRGALLSIYRRLRKRYGPAGWWPGETPFEVAVGAILTQNTAWANVEKALARLRGRGLLRFGTLRRLPASRLAPLIRASGTYRLKARRLAAFLRFLDSEFAGRIEAMALVDPRELRRKLLTVNGIGRETADSIALYAAGLPLFVVDAYTRRVLSRLGLIRGDEAYDELQAAIMRALPHDAPLFNDYHAQIVRLAKQACRARPRCGACPLAELCPRIGVERSP
jgi:endonuclease-3 related protein